MTDGFEAPCVWNLSGGPLNRILKEAREPIFKCHALSGVAILWPIEHLEGFKLKPSHRLLHVPLSCVLTEYTDTIARRLLLISQAWLSECRLFFFFQQSDLNPGIQLCACEDTRDTGHRLNCSNFHSSLIDNIYPTGLYRGQSASCSWNKSCSQS